MAGWPISFSPNVKPGVKRKQENVATKVDKRKYEDKRDRCFQEHWLEKIPWLQHDERGMRCTICCNFYDNSKQQGSSTKNLFLTGSKNYKFSTISDHEKSKTHVEAVEVQKSREKAVAKKTTAHKTLMSLKEHTRKDLEIKFRNEKRLCESLRETETEVTVVDENEVAQGK